MQIRAALTSSLQKMNLVTRESSTLTGGSGPQQEKLMRWSNKLRNWNEA